MNLLCPNCQKMLQVPEQYAGQLMKCPLCTGTFTVPALPQAPPPPPPPPMQSPAMPDFSSPAAPPMTHDTGLKSAPASAPSGNYAHVRSYTVNPKLVPWVAPVCLVAVFVLMFFTWAGMFPASIQVVSQNGWQVAFGSLTDDTPAGEVWRANNKTEMEHIKTNLGSAFFVILFLLLMLMALVLSVASVLVQRGLIPVQVPAGLESIWSLRGFLIFGLAVAALVLLSLQLTSGLPLENATWEEAKAAAARDKPAPETEEGRTLRKMEEGKEFGKFNVQRTSLLTLVLVLMVVACVGAVLDWWVERRGSLPPPRLDLSY